jgi:hypothetical protein
MRREGAKSPKAPIAFRRAKAEDKGEITGTTVNAPRYRVRGARPRSE